MITILWKFDYFNSGQLALCKITSTNLIISRHQIHQLKHNRIQIIYIVFIRLSCKLVFNRCFKMLHSNHMLSFYYKGGHSISHEIH